MDKDGPETMREAVARAIAKELTGGFPSSPKSIDHKAADAAIRTVLERVVKLCDDYGEANMEICGDNILMDPLLRGKGWTDENVRISDDCTIMSTIHSSQYHASQHIKQQVQAMLDAAAREVG